MISNRQIIDQPPTHPPVQAPVSLPVETQVTQGMLPATSPQIPTPPKSTSVVWEGELKREQRNLFSLKVLTRLAQAENVAIKVKVEATLKEGQPLNNGLKELGIASDFKKEQPN